jgi:hypothetical protein
MADKVRDTKNGFLESYKNLTLRFFKKSGGNVIMHLLKAEVLDFLNYRWY